MIKAGILTLYHNSCNYGGVLQAYALTRYLCEQGICARQIDYILDPDTKEKRAERIDAMNASERAGKVASKLKRLFCDVPFNLLYGKKHSGELKTRAAAFDSFRRSIPHTDKAYTSADIADTASDFDAFICGSDQIWGAHALCPAFLLQFVPEDKIKLSYAASIARSKVSPREHELLQSLRRLDAVSVREEASVKLLRELTGINAELCADPVLLLSDKEWSDAASGESLPPLPEEGYAFCYFLGDSKKQRRAAAAFAHEKKLKTVTLPHLLGEFRRCDAHFGDIRITAASPMNFVYLIRHASFVITDSFHASVFSLIFKKQFFVFERQGHLYMTARLTSLLKDADAENRLIKPDASAMLSIADIGYNGAPEGLCRLAASSRRFLTDALKLS